MQSISLPSMIPFIIITNNDVCVLLSEKNVGLCLFVCCYLKKMLDYVCLHAAI